MWTPSIRKVRKTRRVDDVDRNTIIEEGEGEQIDVLLTGNQERAYLKFKLKNPINSRRPRNYHRFPISQMHFLSTISKFIGLGNIVLT